MITRWSEATARAWFKAQPWMVGCNFTPSYAINQIEMWQSETFDPVTIDGELALAQSLGMNAVRIYLHDLLWQQDAPGFIARIDQVLELASARDIGVMLVLFDSCWNPDPALGVQPAPRAGVHNSGWVQSPGMAALKNTKEHGRLEQYVRGIVTSFAADKRILAWDIWNEPDNGPEVALCDPAQIAAKAYLVVPLMTKAFDWARESGATQPLTSGIWLGDWSAPDLLSPIQRAQTGLSDIISFHNYGTAQDFVTRVKWLKSMGRPVLCTEFMARPAGSTFEAILPHARTHGVGAFCWGLVRGRTQTHLPWDKWVSPIADLPDDLWFHDIFDEAGVPHDPREVAFFRTLAAV